MQLRQKIGSFVKLSRQLPRWMVIVVGVGIFGLTAYSVAFFVPKPVTFSYGGATCVPQLNFLPGTYQTITGSGYQAKFGQTIKLAGLSVVSTELCFKPTTAPRPGTTSVQVAPFGSLLGRKTFAIQVADRPVASLAAVKDTLPVTRPLAIALSHTDRVFRYQLLSGDRQTTCRAQEKAVACSLEELGLSQGKSYQVTLARQFNDGPSRQLASRTITTLRAVTVQKSSVKKGQTIYGKPKSFQITTDKQLTAATVTLRQKGHEDVINAKVALEGKVITATISKDLARETSYTLTLDRVEATDGSTLVDPYVVPFKVSGGPKVVGINIGQTGIGLSQTIVVTFDQALSTKQPLGGLVSVKGVAVRTSRQGKQLFISLTGAAKCADFSITIGKGLLSKYEIASQEAWSRKARTTCHSVSTIGYSVHGRPISAYWFGSGNSTVMFTGALHGNEVSASYILQDLIDYLETHARQIPAGRQVVVIPILNPDGVASGSRLNARSVNLNRNFDTSDWKSDIDDTGTGGEPVKDRGGPSPMSEPETRAIAALSAQLRPRLVMSYHAIGSVAIGNEAGDSARLAAKYASMVGYRNGTGQSGEIFDYGISGTYDDWLAQKLGSASIIIELGSYSYRNLSHHQAAMWAMINS